MSKFVISNFERISIIVYLDELKRLKMAILNQLLSISTENPQEEILQQIRMLNREIKAIDKDIEHFSSMSANYIEEV